MEFELAEAYANAGSDIMGAFSLVLAGVVGLVLVVWDSFRNNDPAIPWVAAAALAGGMVWEFTLLSAPSSTIFYDLMRTGGYASFINIVILGSGLLTIFIAVPYFERIDRSFGEVYALILFATVGMIALATSNSMIMIFVGLETMSICLYIMTGFIRENVGAAESALKYFILGAFATGFFLYGIALMYGASGTMYLPLMAEGVEASGNHMLFWAGVGLLLVGFFFKVSAAPFHMWTPDVYQGAPTPLTGYMSTASKASAFGALMLVLFYAIIPATGLDWTITFAVIAVITMLVGNVIALAQSNVKRMLAYSSIAHAGYVLVGLVAGTSAAFSGVLYYLLVYSIMNIGAFGVMAMLEWDDSQGREQSLDSLAGIGFRRPFLGVAMAVFMFSLTGFPPLGGFIAKYAVFAPAIGAGFTWLVLFAVLMSAVSAFYYLRVIFVFWMKSPEETPEAAPARAYGFPVSAGAMFAIAVCTVLLIVLGIAPGLLETTAGYFASPVSPPVSPAASLVP
jgi:NADH-quinone oxidoreductase subunit N